MLLCSISLHQAFGAGGPQRRKVPTSARLAVLRNRYLRSQEAQQEEYLSDEHIREGRNLASVFPFVGGNRALPRARLFGEEPDHHDHHDEHHEHHDEHRNFDPRISRQRNGDGDDIALDIGSIAAAGERCIDKVVMVEVRNLRSFTYFSSDQEKAKLLRSFKQ